MTLVQLRHLIAVTESGSISRSAQALFITQPALSRSIRALEEELGMPLFDRIGRRIEPTAFGREVAARAQQLVLEAEDVKTSGQRLREGSAGVLRIGLGSGPGALLMTPLLVHMAQRHPRIRIRLARGSTELLAHALRDRALDAMLIDARALVPAPDLRLEPFPPLRGAFMCRRSHPLARRGGGVPFSALTAYPIASTPLSDEVARVLVERYGEAAHPTTFVTLQSEDLASLADTVRATDAILLAVRASATDLAELPVRPALEASARYGMVTLAGRSEPPALEIVRRLVSERVSRQKV